MLLTLLLPSVRLAAQATTQASPTRAAAELLGGLPLAFEPNRGQAEPEARFVARGAGYRILLMQRQAVLQFGSNSRAPLRIRPVGANRRPVLVPQEQLPGKSNYLNGATPSTWYTDIPNYGRVLYRDIYPGIDLVFRGNEGHLEYDWVVQPGADPASIRLSFLGARRVRVEGDELVVETAAVKIRNRRPVAYQDIAGTRRYVSCNYALNGERVVSFRLGAHDVSVPLVIDPTVVYLKDLRSLANVNYSFLGPPVIDSAGNIYLLLTGGNYGSFLDPSPQFVMKLNASGVVAFVTQLGLLGATRITYLAPGKPVAAIAVDTAGSVYLAGTSGPGLATTAGVFQPKAGGLSATNAFVAKLNPTGSGLVYSTYLGGGSQDYGSKIAVDGAGSAYVLGGATSTDFPTTTRALGACGGNEWWPTMFTAKLNSSGSSLIYSSCIGGTLGAAASGLAIDAAGNAYVAGTSWASDFPTTPGAFQTKPPSVCSSGPCNGFALKLNPAGSAFLYSTFLPAIVNAMAADSSGCAYTAGEFSSFTPTPGALQTGPNDHGFVAKLNAGGSGLVYTAIVGGSPSGVAVDASGNTYVVGTVGTTYATYGPGFP